MPASFDCPPVQVRNGASTLTSSANPAEPSAMNLRYQVTVTTTARECLRVVTAASKAEWLGTGLDDSALFVDDAAIDEEILVAERNAALRAAFAELPPRCQQLLSMLLSDPPHSYADIHRELGIPVGSIGPQRARCLERMRRSSALAALGEGEDKIDIRGGEPGA